jgi:hypothetical protein
VLVFLTLVANIQFAAPVAKSLGCNLLWPFAVPLFLLYFVLDHSRTCARVLSVSRFEVLYLLYMLWGMLSIFYSTEPRLSLERFLGIPFLSVQLAVFLFSLAGALVEKIRHYLGYEDETEKMRLAGHRRCLSENNLDHRAQRIASTASSIARKPPEVGCSAQCTSMVAWHFTKCP